MRFTHSSTHSTAASICMPRRCTSASLTMRARRLCIATYPPRPITSSTRLACIVRDWSWAFECMFAWYWLADLCAREQLDFVLGHALYMKASHFVTL